MAGVAHPKLRDFHLCSAALTDNKTVWTARHVVVQDVPSESLFGALRIGAMDLDEETVVFDVGGKEVSLACELAAIWTVEAFDDELVYHLGKRMRNRGRKGQNRDANVADNGITRNHVLWRQ